MVTRNLLINGPITVPSDFMGHHPAYPYIGSAPTIPIGNVRMLDYASGASGPFLGVTTRWYGIEQTQGNYTWTDLDTFVTYWRSVGATITYPVFGTPSFYTTMTTLDSDLKVGGYAYPDLDTNLTATQNFITALVTRYNTPGGAWALANPTLFALGHGIKAITPCNEPTFYNAYFTGVAAGTTAMTSSNLTSGTITSGNAAVANNGRPMFIYGTGITPGTYILSGSGTSWVLNQAQTFNTTVTGIGTAYQNFWWGTYTQTVDFCHAVYTAAHTVDSTIQVTSPAFTSAAAFVPTFANTAGTIYPSIYGSQTFDALDFHCYNCAPFGQPYGTFAGDVVGGNNGIGDALELSKLYANNVPVIMSEYGFDFGTDIMLNSLLNETPAFRYTYLGRIILQAMAMGILRIDLFRYIQPTCGNWQAGNVLNGTTYSSADTNGVIAAFIACAALVGKTITSATAVFGGSTTILCSDGTTLTI